jgi:hypothetical protein
MVRSSTSGKFDAKERIGVFDGLSHGSWDTFVEQGAASRQVAAAHGAEEHGQRALVVAAGAGREDRAATSRNASPLGTEKIDSSSSPRVATLSGSLSAGWSSPTSPMSQGTSI